MELVSKYIAKKIFVQLYVMNMANTGLINDNYITELKSYLNVYSLLTLNSSWQHTV